jgi:WD40 repeat protein
LALDATGPGGLCPACVLKLYTISIGTAISRLAFSPDGSRLLVFSDDRVMTLWNALNGTHVLTIRPGDHGPGSSPAIRRRVKHFGASA